RVALEVEHFLIALAEPRIEDELRRTARVADALRLGERQIVGDAVLGLARGEALEERGAAVLQAVENRTIELRRVRDGNLRHKRRSMAGQARLRNGLLLDVLPLRGGTKHVHVVR